MDDNKKKHKTFKEYYQDEEFKERHNNYIKQKVPCECGRQVMRVQLAKHKRTKIHEKGLKAKSQSGGGDMNIKNIVDKLVEERMKEFLKTNIKKIK